MKPLHLQGHQSASFLFLKNGIKTLQQHIVGTDLLSRLSSAPILLLESSTREYGPDTHNNKKVEQVCQHVNFLFSRQLGLRVAVSRTSTYSAFPTNTDVRQVIDMAKRIGASTLVAMGSGTAMDLAKATIVETSASSIVGSQRKSRPQNMFEQVILIPATCGAIIAAASPIALLFDTAEDAIVPSRAISRANTDIPTTIAVFDGRTADYIQGRDEAILACISLILDHLLQMGYPNLTEGPQTTEADGLSTLETLLTILTTDESDRASFDDEDLCSSLLLSSDRFMSFGTESEGLPRERSAPLALAASLLPRAFPETDMISLMASLTPSLLRILTEKAREVPKSPDDSVKHKIESLLQLHDSRLQNLSPRIMTTESVDVLHRHMRANQSLWNCWDSSDEYLMSLLRDRVFAQ